jgi:hypothetical protein
MHAQLYRAWVGSNLLYAPHSFDHPRPKPERSAKSEDTESLGPATAPETHLHLPAET